MQRSILTLTCALLPLTASAQRFSFGVQGGFPAQTPLEQTDSKMPFVLGPTAEIQVFNKLSFSTGLLFSRAGERSDDLAFTLPDGGAELVFHATKSRAIEAPLLAKYRFVDEHRSLRPFFTVGAAIRRTTIDTTQASSVLASRPIGGAVLASAMDTHTVKWNADPTVGVGLDFQRGRFHIEPEVRYSYWGAGKHTELLKNQVQFLLGFRF